jgi:hypothetical protein
MIAQPEEIQTTPEMAQSGANVLASSGRMAEGELSSDTLLAEEVFKATLSTWWSGPTLEEMEAIRRGRLAQS